MKRDFHVPPNTEEIEEVLEILKGQKPLHLESWDFEGFDLSGVCFSRANLFGANFLHSKLIKADFSYANLQHVEFGIANLTEADLTGADLYITSFVRTTLRSAILRGVHARADFAFASLVGADCYKADLKGSDFMRANLTNANLRYTDLTDVRFYCTNLQGADLRGAIVYAKQLEEAASLEAAKLPTFS